MYRFIHCTIAALCAASACVYLYLAFSQHFFYSFFAVSTFVLFRLHYAQYRSHILETKQAEIQNKLSSILVEYEQMQQVIRQRESEEIKLFRKEHEMLLEALAMEYLKYVAEEFAADEDYPQALTAATEKMMLRYGDDIYAAFKDTSPTAFMNLSPSMSIANLEAAKRVISTFGV